MMSPIRTVCIVVGFIVAAAVLRPTPVATQAPLIAGLAARVTALENQVATLQAQVTALQAAAVPQSLLDLASYVTVDTNTIEDLVGPHIIFSGANVHIRNGSGATNGNVANRLSFNYNDALSNGLGNLIIGYNEKPLFNPFRWGSHNLVVGVGHQYDSIGGLVAGYGNWTRDLYSSVTGGFINTASSSFASVTGGGSNSASGSGSSVSGGFRNAASGHFSSISGGGEALTQTGFMGWSGGAYHTP